MSTLGPGEVSNVRTGAKLPVSSDCGLLFRIETWLEPWFKIYERGSTLATEVRAGTATFLAMCYIVFVNAAILSDSGGPCPDSRKALFHNVSIACDDPFVKFNYFDDPTGCYAECVADTRAALITTTAVSSFVGSVMMGTAANLPFALAPGMGLNAYFTYNVVGFMGSNKNEIDWRSAMTAVFLEGLIFLMLALSGLRITITKSVPSCIKLATSAGIGLFLAHVGLQSSEGIGMVVADPATAVTIGGCAPKYRHPMFLCSDRDDPTSGYCLSKGQYTCDIDPSFPQGNQGGGVMNSSTMWLGIMGFLLISILMVRKIQAAIVFGVALVTFLSWFKNTDISYFEDDVLKGGNDRWEYFKQVVFVEPIGHVAGKLKLSSFVETNMWKALATFLYVDLLDSVSTFFAMAKFAGLMDDKGDFEGQHIAYCVDGLATSLGALMGTSPVTTYIESAAGIEEGGRTGITAIVTGMWFFCCIFFAPILASVPPWATGPALIVLGALMMKGCMKIDWSNNCEAIPAFITIVLMPLTYSVAYGIIGGLFTYACINIPGFCIDFLLGEARWPPKYLSNIFSTAALDECTGEMYSNHPPSINSSFHGADSGWDSHAASFASSTRRSHLGSRASRHTARTLSTEGVGVENNNKPPSSMIPRAERTTDNFLGICEESSRSYTSANLPRVHSSQGMAL